jgi:hypothetical protein
MSRLALSTAVLACLLAPALPALAEKLPSGTEMVLRLSTDINPGKKTSEDFRGELAVPVFVNGHEVLPAGTRVEGEVRGDKQRVILSPRYLYLPGGQRVDFNAAVKDIDRKKLRAEEKEGTIQNQGSGADAARTAAEVGMMGAGVGAMSTGTAKGMGIGAAAGVAAVLIGHKVANSRKTTYIPAGTQLTFNLSRPIDVPDNIAQMPPSDQARDPDDRRPILHRKIDH